VVDGCDVLDDGFGPVVVVQAEHGDERRVIVETDALDTLHLGGECFHHLVFVHGVDRDVRLNCVFRGGYLRAVVILRDECDVVVAGLQVGGVVGL